MADAGQGPKKIIQALHAECAKSVDSSFNSRYDQFNGQSYGLATDLDVWAKVLANRKECALFESAAAEYVSALLNVSQSQYRDAFKGLRLTLELTLQGVYLSTYLVLLEEWLSGKADTNWREIVDENDGVFAKRFCRAFFEALVDEMASFRTLAETLYREMSECIHGNVPKRIPLPSKIGFDEPTFVLWHQKSGSLRLLINFVLAMRYLGELSSGERDQVEAVLVGQLGHMPAVRVVFGGQK